MRRSLVAVAAGLLVFLGGQASLAGPRARVAILPIVVHTLENKGFLQAGLADMLASRLGRLPGVAVIRVQGEDRATTDLETAQKTAQEAGAEHVIFGSFTQFGEGASLDLLCAPVTSEDEEGSRSIFIQSGTLGEIIPQLDKLAERISLHLAGGGAASEGLPAVGAAGPGDTLSDAQIQDALSELEALRGRVDALEQRVFAPPVERLPDDDLRSGLDVIETDPELHSDLR
jgi:hypothetical protein